MFGIFFVLTFIGPLTAYNEPTSGQYWPQPEVIQNHPSNEECVRRIYSECNYPTTFSDEELENVRQYLNYSFTVLADIKPDKPLCPKLHVRQDWKCLTQQQKTRVINVWHHMYQRGDVQRLTDIHVKYWPAWHKTVEILPSHRWFCNEFEKIMRSLDPKTALPYWDPYTYGSQPERSSIWDVLGHSGNYSNGYSVIDGIYAGWGLMPTIKRHWSPDKTILPWYTQEFITNMLQTSNSYTEMVVNALGLHFPPHVNVGGYEGQYSVREAPYDVLFYMHHSSNVDGVLLKWQLQKKEFLTPLSYNRLQTFNPIDGNIQRANIMTDILNGVPDVTIKELFWVGFGEYCSIPDQLIRPINNFWKGIRDPIPSAAKRLPQWLLEKYFPSFDSGNFTGLSHTLEEVGECNTVCHPIPKPTFLSETQAGRRQLEAYRYDGGLDQGSDVVNMEQKFYQMWLDMNDSDYCSPYITSNLK